MPESAPPPASNLDGLRLPKAIDGSAAGPALLGALRASARPLWSGGAWLAPVARWSEPLAAALDGAQRAGQLSRGLEQVEAALQREAHGQSLVDARAGATRGSRVSRLLLISNDGSERFYRQVERMARTHAPRLLVIRVEASSAEFAERLPQGAGVVRALLVDHKDAVVRVLEASFAS